MKRSEVTASQVCQFLVGSLSFKVITLVSINLTEVSITVTNVQSVEDIKIRLEQVKVVAVTCLGISSPLLTNMRFDVCIMDEAGQTTLPVCSLCL